MIQILEIKEPKGKIQSPEDLFKRIKRIRIDYSQENFLVIYLNTKNKVISSEVVFKGGLNSCLIDVKTLFRKALIKNSCKIIVAHNHPSKELTPSQEDLILFEKLKEMGDLLQLPVLDSIIFNKKEFYSLREK
jgi:DNA repair protein RadC